MKSLRILRQSTITLAPKTGKGEIYVTTTQKKDGDVVAERFTVDPKGIDWRYRELFSEKYNFKPEYTSQDWLDAKVQMFNPKKPAQGKAERYLWQLVRKLERWMTIGDDMHVWHLPPGFRAWDTRLNELSQPGSKSHRAADAFKIRFWDRDETRMMMERKRRMRIFRARHQLPYYRMWNEQRVPLLEEFITQTRKELVSADPHDREFIEKLRHLSRAKRRLQLAKEALAEPNRSWYPFTLLPGKEDNPQVYMAWGPGSGHPLDRMWWHHRWDDLGDSSLHYVGVGSIGGALPQKYA